MPSVDSPSPPAPGGYPVQVRRSTKRKRTVSADLRGGVAVVSIPAHFTAAQEKEWVGRMLTKLRARYGTEPDARDTRGASGNELLVKRAVILSESHLGGRGKPAAITWVTNQNSRWGSATPSRKTIRLSHKLQGMPDWVVDYVILHEMAHLIEPSHGPAFWRLLESYPRTETAKAFLAGAAFAADHALAGR